MIGIQVKKQNKKRKKDKKGPISTDALKSEKRGNDSNSLVGRQSTVPVNRDQSVSSSSFFKFFENIALTDKATLGNLDSNPYGYKITDGKLILGPSLDHRSVETKADADQEFGINQINAKVQQEVKVKLPKYIDSKQGIVSEHPFDRARKRVQNYNPSESSQRNYYVPIVPKVINYMLNLNISGHLPHPTIERYKKFVDDVNSLNIEKQEKVQVNDRHLSTFSYGEVKKDNISDSDVAKLREVIDGTLSDFTSLPNDIKSYVSHPSLVKQRLKASSPMLSIREIPLTFNHSSDLIVENILEDNSTIQYMNSIHKIRLNGQEFYKNNPKMRIPLFINNVDVINSVITPSIEMATALYILIDAFKSTFNYRATIGIKTGLVDSFLKYFMNQSNV